MKPVCQALAILQEDNTYMGILSTTITTCIKKLDLLLKELNQSICLFSASAMKDGLLNLFGNLLNLDYISAPSFHPHFKLKWQHLHASISIENVDSLRNQTINKLSLMQAITRKNQAISIHQIQKNLERRFLAKLLITKTFLIMKFILKNRAKSTRQILQSFLQRA